MVVLTTPLAFANDSEVTQPSELLEENISDRFYLTFLEKLLLIEPESVDTFTLLENDIKRFQSELDAVTNQYSSAITDFNKFKNEQTNQYNLSEEFRLFDQLKSQQHKQEITLSEYEVNKVREKLYYSLFEYESIKKRVEDKYQAKHQASLELLKEKLLAGESFILIKGQKQQILKFLMQYKNNPKALAKMLMHKNVQEILPDYLIEQLNIFSQSNIELADALSSPQVMDAVIARISEVDVLPQMGLEDVGAKLYSEQYAPKVLKLGSKPLMLNMYLDANIKRKLSLARLYELPVPSRDVVNL
jgi:hypothetical protein